MFNGFDTENDYLDSLKKDNSYHFSIPFEYIKKNYGNDEYDIGVTNMEVDVIWSDSEHGYMISYYVPEMYLIDPSESNGDEDEFYEYAVQDEVLNRLEDMGIGPEAMYGGIGR